MPGCGAHCKLAPFVLQNMFCFYTTRIAYYLTSSAGERQLGLGAPPSLPPAMGGTAIFEGLLPSSGEGGIIPGEGSQLLSAHPGHRARGLTLPGSFMSAPSGFVALGR